MTVHQYMQYLMLLLLSMGLLHTYTWRAGMEAASGKGVIFHKIQDSWYGTGVLAAWSRHSLLVSRKAPARNDTQLNQDAQLQRQNTKALTVVDEGMMQAR